MSKRCYLCSFINSGTQHGTKHMLDSSNSMLANSKQVDNRQKREL